jgi:hypothetical protein
VILSARIAGVDRLRDQARPGLSGTAGGRRSGLASTVRGRGAPGGPRIPLRHDMMLVQGVADLVPDLDDALA